LSNEAGTDAVTHGLQTEYMYKTHDIVDVYEVPGGFILVDCHNGKGGTSFRLVQKPQPQRRPRRLEDCESVCTSQLHTHSPAATPHISNMGALLSLPLLAIPSVGTVSEQLRYRDHPPATRPRY
jgi:hypothetical protein